MNIGNAYLISGPYRIGPGNILRYIVRRRVADVNQWIAASCRNLRSAETIARRIRTVDARTWPERSSWPIVRI